MVSPASDAQMRNPWRLQIPLVAFAMADAFFSALGPLRSEHLALARAAYQRGDNPSVDPGTPARERRKLAERLRTTLAVAC